MIINKFFIVSKYFNALIGFVAILIIAKQLSIVNFGDFSFYKLMNQYLVYSEAGLLQYMFRKQSTGKHIDKSELEKIITYLLISIFSVLTVFTVIGLNWIDIFTQPVFFIFIFISVFINIITKFITDQLRIRKQLRRVVLLETLSSLLLLSGTSVFLYLNITDVIYYIILISLYLIPNLIYIVYDKKIRQLIMVGKLTFKLDSKVLFGSSMLFLYSYLSIVFGTLDRMFIKFGFGLESLGLYSFAYTVVMGFYLIIQSIMWMNMPNFLYEIKNNDIQAVKNKFRQYTKSMVLIYLFTFIISIILYWSIVNFYMFKFTDTMEFFILIHIYQFFNIFLLFEHNYLIAFEKYKILNKIIISFIFINIAMSYTLLQLNNVYILLIGSIILYILYILIVKKVVRKCYQ